MRRLLLSAALALALAGCSGEAAPTSRGVYLLMDTSGTYTKELHNAQAIINAILAKLEPGDSFAVARVDTGSFSEKDIVARVTFDERPSVTNQQKRKFRDQIDAFVKKVEPAAYTDITGGVLQAVEYLNEKNPGRKTILVFSDLEEDLAGRLRARHSADHGRLRSGRGQRHQAAHGQRGSARVHDPPGDLAEPRRVRRRRPGA